MLWVVGFLALLQSGNTGVSALVAIPVFLTALLFGIRGAVLGSTAGILGFGALHSVVATDSFAVLVRDGNIVNIAVLTSLALLTGYARRFPKADRTEDQVFSDVDADLAIWLDSEQSQIRREQLRAISDEFNSSAHKSLEVHAVSRSAVDHISRALQSDFVAIAIADQENRQATIEHAIGLRLLGFETGDARPVSEVLSDPIASPNIAVMSRPELVEMSNVSFFAATSVEVGVQSVLTACLRNDDDLVAQIWICSVRPEQFTELDVEFVAQISDHLTSAVINARNAESLKELQRYLVGQNEQFAQMQDGIENIEGELRLSHKQLTELNESKTQFMSEVAHEIKSPLAVMIGYADLLRFDTENLDADQREFASSIEKSARQLAVLIDDLSDITNIESGHFTTAKEPHNVARVIQSVIDGLKVSGSEIESRLVVSDSLFEFEVEGDPARLSQVFTNLITNALKYSDDDQPVEVSSVKTAAGTIRVSVTDHGLGISDEDIERLFTPYFRSMNPEAQQRPGTGLGLFLSKSIVEQHGGSLVVSSQIGVGSKFTVELPGLLNHVVADAA